MTNTETTIQLSLGTCRALLEALQPIVAGEQNRMLVELSCQCDRVHYISFADIPADYFFDISRIEES